MAGSRRILSLKDFLAYLKGAFHTAMPITFARIHTIAATYNRFTVADRLERSRLDKLREEMCIPVVELNLISTTIVGRQIRDARFLSDSESRKVRKYLKENYNGLSEKYRRMRWK
jgi:hypothetical protein